MLPCLQNPTTHYRASDWGLISGNPYTWIAKDNTNGPIKSIYDPCPYGYRVPKDGSWAGFPGKSWTDGTINEGQLWKSTWWPAAGGRYYGSAALVGIASYAHYWSSSFYSSATDYRSYYLYFYYNGSVGPSGTNNRSYGLSLRCIQE